MTQKIFKGMVKVDNRKIVRQGSCVGVSIPRTILNEIGVEKGDTVALYNNGKGQILIDLKPDED